MEEKRKHPRIKTANLVTYVCVDENDHPLYEGIGETLDISLGGLKMQMSAPIDTDYIMIIAIDTNDEITEIKGEGIYRSEAEPNKFHTGVHFVESDDRIRKFVIEMVKIYNPKNRSS